MEKYIYQFVRKNSGQAVGVVLATKSESGDVLLGWSRCNTSAGDTFDKKFALKIALERAVKGSGKQPPVSFNEALAQMQERGNKYFRVTQ